MKLTLALLGALNASEQPDLSEIDINEPIRLQEGLADGDIKGPTHYSHYNYTAQTYAPKPETKSALRDQWFRWPHEVNYVPIPFEMEDYMPIITRGIAQDAAINYKLRTCIDLKPWEGEDHYVRIFQGGGCYSYLGWSYYSQQTLSIGARCNSQVGTFQHEFMHALGIFHEQSRPDRDTYVFINLTDVRPGTEGNFNKYDFDLVSIEDVPYDYESVMHYSATGFVQTPGGTSIDPYIPYFSQVIGQRKNFSRNDVAKINRMYQCAGPLLDSFSCDFTEENICGFVNQPIDDPEMAERENRLDWKQFDVKKNTIVGDISANKLDPSTGDLRDEPLDFPNQDHSNGLDGYGRYMMLNGSAFSDVDNSGRVGILESRRFDSRSDVQCLEVWTNVAGADSELYIQLWEADNVYGEVVGSMPLEEFKLGDTDGNWKINRWTVNAPEMFKILVKGKLGSNDDIMLIDDISVIDRACESHRFEINDFSSVYEKTAKGEYVESEIMTASTGHRFVLRFYPRGHPNREDEDYASLFLHLHESSNDLGLAWPWHDQYLKFIAQDQVPDVLFRMDQNRIRATEFDEDNPERWNMVTDPDENGVSREQAVIGYETFIPTFDIFESSYSYVKHDTFMIFVEVRDLSELDTSSKLSTCFDEGDDPTKEAEEQEAERLTCFSLCDFDETNPCTSDEVCSQSDIGVECKSQATISEPGYLKAAKLVSSVGEYDLTDDNDGSSFTSFQMGVSIALSVMGTLIAIGIIYGIIQYRRMVKLRKLTQELTMQSIQRHQTLPPSYAPKAHKNSAFNEI